MIIITYCHDLTFYTNMFYGLIMVFDILPAYNLYTSIWRGLAFIICTGPSVTALP